MATFGAFSAPGRWFRGNCHTHTLLSDGKAERRTDRAGVPARGIRFRRADRSRAGAGESLGPGRQAFPGHQRHRAASAGARTAARRAVSHRRHRRGAFAGARVGGEGHGGVGHPLDRARKAAWRCTAHPYWCGHDLGLMREGKRAFGVEVFNSVCEGMRRPGRFERPPRPGAVGGHPLDGVRGGRHAPAGARRLRRVDHGQGARADAGRHPRGDPQGAFLRHAGAGDPVVAREGRRRALDLLARAEDRLARRRVRTASPAPRSAGRSAGTGSRSSASSAAPGICAWKSWTPPAARRGAIPSGAPRAPAGGATDLRARSHSFSTTTARRARRNTTGTTKDSISFRTPQ